jgi:uncharacterized protein (DUF342 family)
MGDLIKKYQSKIEKKKRRLQRDQEFLDDFEKEIGKRKRTLAKDEEVLACLIDINNRKV